MEVQDPECGYPVLRFRSRYGAGGRRTGKGDVPFPERGARMEAPRRAVQAG